MLQLVSSFVDVGESFVRYGNLASKSWPLVFAIRNSGIEWWSSAVLPLRSGTERPSLHRNHRLHSQRLALPAAADRPGRVSGSGSAGGTVFDAHCLGCPARNVSV